MNDELKTSCPSMLVGLQQPQTFFFIRQQISAQTRPATRGLADCDQDSRFGFRYRTLPETSGNQETPPISGEVGSEWLLDFLRARLVETSRPVPRANRAERRKKLFSRPAFLAETDDEFETLQPAEISKSKFREKGNLPPRIR